MTKTTEREEPVIPPYSLGGRNLVGSMAGVPLHELRDRELIEAIKAKYAATAERVEAIDKLNQRGNTRDPQLRDELQYRLDLATGHVHQANVALVEVGNERAGAEADRFDQDADIGDELRDLAQTLIERMTYQDGRRSLSRTMRALEAATVFSPNAIPSVHVGPSPETAELAKTLEAFLAGR